MVEELANHTAWAGAINLVIARHILLMTLVGRDHPDLPSHVMFSKLESGC